MTSEFEKKKQRHASGDSTMSGDSISNYIPTPPDGGWGWMIVLASFVNHIIVDGVAFTFGVFYTEFLVFFKEGKGKTAFVGSFLCGFYLMTGPIAGALTNKYGCRVVCITGTFIASGSFVVSTFSPNVDMLMVTYGIFGGFGFGLIYLPSIISVSYYFDKKRALATGIAVCGAGVGTFIFAPLGRALLDRYSWQNAMLIVAALVLNSAICGALMRPLQPPRVRKRRPRSKNVLDRLREQPVIRKLLRPLRRGARGSDAAAVTGSDAGGGGATAGDAAIVQRVKEAKLAREQAIRDEESESEMSSMPSLAAVAAARRRSGDGCKRQDSITTHSTAGCETTEQTTGSSVSRQGSLTVPHSSTLPQIKVGDTADSQQELGDAATEQQADVGTGLLDNTTPQKKALNSPRYSLPFLNRIKKEDQAGTNGSALNGSLPAMLNGTDSQSTLPACDSRNPETDHVMNMSPCEHSVSSDHMNLLSPDTAHGSARMRHPVPKIPGVSKEDYARPLYRKDIFYSGSVLNITRFKSQPDVKSYIASITSIPPADSASGLDSRLWSCIPVPKAVKDALQDMLDFTILRDPVFLIACLGNIFGMIGLYMPFVYLADRSISLGVDESKAAFLLSVIGITNTLGRVLAGWLADFPWVNTLLLHNMALLVGGISCFLNMFCNNYALMCTFATVFGFCVATWISLTTIVLCNLLGLEKLTNAFGLLTLTRGMASIAGPPVAGFVFDATLNYDNAFHIGGAMLVMAGACFCLLHLPVFRRRALSKHNELVAMEIGDDVFEDDDVVTPADDTSAVPVPRISITTEQKESGSDVTQTEDKIAPSDEKTTPNAVKPILKQNGTKSTSVTA